jgi:tetratricopeptide (TPR) repeat protein/transglutaminase-like putative cysteine protease
MIRARLALCFLCLACAAGAQDAPTTTAQSAAAPRAKSAVPQAAPADFSQEPFVIEQYFTTARFENDGTGEFDLTERIRVQSDAGVQQLSELVFGYNSASEQTEIRYVRVRKPDGTIVTADADAIKEVTAAVAHDAPIYTDYKEKHVTVPALAPGVTLEYEVVKRLITPLAPGEFWYQHTFFSNAIALDERLEVNVPEARKIKIESAPDAAPEKTREGGRAIYRWKRANLKLASDEASDNDAGKTPQKAEAKLPDVQITSFAGWAEVGRWYSQLEAGRAEATPEIRNKTEQLTSGRLTDIDKIQSIYDYVSTNIRYVSLSFGLGRYQPHTAAEVFANQYGDCKDKHTLLAAMLGAAGFHADAVLIPSARTLDETIPSPSQFDHVITAVRRTGHGGEGLLWMDSTTEVAPFRLLAATLRHKAALLVPADGPGEIVTTPADPPFPSTQKVEIEGRVSELGKLTASVHYTLRGDTELLLRRAFRSTSQAQWLQLGQTIFAFDGLHGDVTAVKPSDPAATHDPFELVMEFTQSNFLDWSSKKSKTPLPLLTIGLPDPPENASAPIELGSPLAVSVGLKLDFPAGFLAQAPIAVSVSRDYAEFKSSYHFAGHTLTAERSLDFKMRELPAARAGDFQAFTRAVTSDESQALVVENTASGAPELPPDAKAEDLFDAGAAALNSSNLRAAIPLLERTVALDPGHKQAWNDLGLAYLRTGKNDEAVSAFRKQLEINGFDEHANEYLGIAFQQQEKYPEAIAAFRKQAELNPLDPIAHAALGQILLEQHSGAEAVAELEKATILSPENAALQVNLGRAYLETGEQEKALATFERSAELSPTPMVWNNIAFNLADHKIDLDKAQQYAESAIAATAVKLRNIELAHVTAGQIGDVNSLAAYWDTLGWVDFQKGDLAAASRYVNAAWVLAGNGELADHLGQIYEKQGQKDLAIHTYSMALAAPHASADARARLTLMLGGNAEIDRMVRQAAPEVAALRSFSLPGPHSGDASAEFLIVLAPNGSDGASTKVEGVKFISGSESLRPLAEKPEGKLATLDYRSVFPDASAVEIVRRGTVSCSGKSGNCALILFRPEDVRSLK